MHENLWRKKKADNTMKAIGDQTVFIDCMAGKQRERKIKKLKRCFLQRLEN